LKIREGAAISIDWGMRRKGIDRKTGIGIGWRKRHRLRLWIGAGVGSRDRKHVGFRGR
jgi:hypothetical protein